MEGDHGRINLRTFHLPNNGYTAARAHINTKLAMVLFAKELAKRLQSSGISNVKTYSINPRIIDSRPGEDSDISTNKLFRYFKTLFMLPADMGPQPYLHCALDDALANESGHFYDNCRRVDCMTGQAFNDRTARDLWHLSVDLVNLESQYKL
ncbi:unnamed protein product [Oppiella nova]|uniref:Uncharacterized protein n=1 Tax=Oppiella nova TaxID=334625 RepID=A0A7R9MJ48_9ACAR|nr:unnamed protein product [Oppiella nova]CAG2177367.1 unnamed protein product [Oppiella nova]